MMVTRGRIWESSLARMDLASALIRAHRHAEALPVLDEVLPTARRLESLPLLRRTEELQRAARSRAGEQEPWAPLTVREFEVARMVAEGLTNGEIGEELFVAPKTVNAHIEHYPLQARWLAPRRDRRDGREGGGAAAHARPEPASVPRAAR